MISPNSIVISDILSDMIDTAIFNLCLLIDESFLIFFLYFFDMYLFFNRGGRFQNMNSLYDRRKSLAIFMSTHAVKYDESKGRIHSV